MWQEIRELFPVHERVVYLNNAGVSPPSVRVLEALDAYHRTHAHYGAMRLFVEYRHMGGRIKEILAELFGCTPSSIALTHNTSEGMNIVAQGLAWSEGDTVLGLEREYPANVYPWWNLERRGVRYFRLEPTNSGGDIDALEARMDGRTRVVAISPVDWCTGYVHDLERLGAVCRRQGVLLVVDTAQTAGIVPLDMGKSGAAAMAGSAWKWLMGPVGLGVFSCDPKLLDRLDLVCVGTNTVRDDAEYLDYDFTPKPDASRFQFSTANYNDWVYFLAALQLLEEIGFDRVRERILSLNDVLREGLEGKGYEVLGSGRPEERSGILSFQRGDLDAKRKVSELMEKGIVTAERDGAIRVSPHIHNNEDDIRRLLDSL